MSSPGLPVSALQHPARPVALCSDALYEVQVGPVCITCDRCVLGTDLEPSHCGGRMNVSLAYRTFVLTFYLFSDI